MPPSPTSDLAALVACDVQVCDTSTAVQAMHRLRHVRGWLDRFEADLTSRLAALHEQGSGAPAADMHTRNSGVSAREARAKERRAKALHDAPSFGDALASGRVGAEHADALATVTGKLDDSTKAAFLSHEQTLLVTATQSSPEQFGRRCRELVNRIARDQGIARAEQQRRETHLSRRVDANGMHYLSGVFHPELGAAIFTALDAEVAKLVAASDDRSLDRNHLAGLALGSLVSGGHQAIRPTQAEVIVLIDERTATTGELHDHSVCETDTGAPMTPASVRRMLCDSVIVTCLRDSDGVVLDAGRNSRLANRAQRRALRAMYRTCAFHGCDVAFNRCEIHHILPWERGGPTNLRNLVPLCARHHHVVHEGGWSLHLAPDRALTIRQPDGDVFAISRLQIRPPGDATDADRSVRDHRRQPDDQMAPTLLA